MCFFSLCVLFLSVFYLRLSWQCFFRSVRFVTKNASALRCLLIFYLDSIFLLCSVLFCSVWLDAVCVQFNFFFPRIHRVSVSFFFIYSNNKIPSNFEARPHETCCNCCNINIKWKQNGDASMSMMMKRDEKEEEWN